MNIKIEVYRIKEQIPYIDIIKNLKNLNSEIINVMVEAPPLLGRAMGKTEIKLYFEKIIWKPVIKINQEYLVKR